MKKVSVDGFEIGGDRTFIIADIGSNHKQDLSLAKESIDAAKESGVNAVKFQSIQLEELYLNPDPKTADFIRKLEFPEDWHRILKEYSDEKGILFFSSPTYLKAVDIFEEVGVPLIKLASAQVGTFPQIVEKVASLHKPTIFSTGIADYSEITNAVQIFKKHKNDQYVILHCNSIYPTPPDRVNLQLIDTYKHMFGNPVGFSDHTDGIHVSLAAVAMGANVIEKHFTLSRNLDTPDCSTFASDPAELKLLVDQIRAIEDAKNVFQERLVIQDEENQFKQSIRYIIVAALPIEKGDLVTVDKLHYLRDVSGIDCRDSDLVVGKTATRNIDKKELITLDMIT